MSPRKILCFLLIFSAIQYAQPKLVVGIVVDQMRYDFLFRFRNNFAEGGFNRLMNEGTNFTFAHYNYIPTKTAPGHASVFTGTTPFYHGIIGNDWYSHELKRNIGCTEDKRYNGLGGPDQMSPLNMLTSTITDQLKISNNGRSKVISISIKDRGAILPGGRMADAAYWYTSENGNFMSSTYYMKELPKWVNDFNAQKLAAKYADSVWTLSKPMENYRNSFPDENPYEADVFSENGTTFPHSLKNVKEKNKLEIVKNTPSGNQILVDFAKASVQNEMLGQHEVPDFLTISFSSTDYVGHAYGPNSVEIHDMFIKLDSQIADLLEFLDKSVGKGNYVMFLTADHGVDETPGWGNVKLKQGFSNKSLTKAVKEFAKTTYNTDNLIEEYSNRQFFLNDSLMAANKLNQKEVRQNIAEFVRVKYPAVFTVSTRDELAGKWASRIPENPLLNGFNQSRSGDILVELSPFYDFDNGKEKANHSSAFTYDTHVPLLFYGWGIKRAQIADPVYVVDIAATVADLLKITEPSGCIGIPIIK